MDNSSKDAKKNLVIIDTNVFLHSVVTQFERNGIANQNTKDEVLYFNTMYMLSGAYLENILPEDSREIEVVFAMDLTPYWRTPKLKELNVVYKGKRNTAVQSHRSLLINPLKERLFNYLLEEYDQPLFSMYIDRLGIDFPLVGFEADDIAAGMVLTQYMNYNHIYVMTNDHDWLPFTQFPNVTWLNISEGHPRIRDYRTALTWVRTCSESQKTNERKSFQFLDIKDLWKFKAYFGDTSDNIPGDKKDGVFGRYIEYIDLFNPSFGFECWKQPDFMEKFQSSKSRVRPILTMEEIDFWNSGNPLCMQPFQSNKVQV